MTIDPDQGFSGAARRSTQRLQGLGFEDAIAHQYRKGSPVQRRAGLEHGPAIFFVPRLVDVEMQRQSGRYVGQGHGTDVISVIAENDMSVRDAGAAGDVNVRISNGTLAIGVMSFE